MKQREFITLLGGATAAQPLTVRAQQASRMRHIGVIVAEENDPEGKAQLSGFTQGLSDLGWTNGSNLHMDVRWGGGDVNQIRAFAKELVAERPPTQPQSPEGGLSCWRNNPMPQVHLALEVFESIRR